MSTTHTQRPIRVLHVVPRTFGRHFGGHTHYVFSLLSGWRDEDIVLDLWGSSVRPVNIGSGSINYELSVQLWPQGVKKPSVIGRLIGYVRQLAFIATSARSIDIAHFHVLGWDTLLSPLLLHSIGRKAIFNSTLYGSDNPSAVTQSRGGRLAGRFLRNFDGILTISPLLAEDYRASGFGNVECIPHFLALPQLAGGRAVAARAKVRAMLSIPQDATTLLFVGAVIRRKGVDLLAEGYARLAARNHNLWLVIVGPCSRTEACSYDEAFVDAIRKRIERAGATSRVVWTGTVHDRAALAEYYSAADILVLPTRAEGLGNVLIEAASAGLPAVATNLPGVTDVVIADGETGLLFPLEDPDALTEAVGRLVSDPVLRGTMGRAARAQSRRFGFEEYCRRLKAFYLQVAGSAIGPTRSKSRRAELSCKSEGRP
jgi:glycosyltransferase involved in cell wall biosynthesis